MPNHANLPIGNSSCWVPVHIMSYPFYNLYSHELNKGELPSKILLYESDHITKKDGMCVIMISLLSQVRWDQRCSEIPHLVTSTIDIERLHCSKSNCYLHCSQQFSTSFEITAWIGQWLPNMFCLPTMSTNGSPPKVTSMAATGGLFGSQQCQDDNVGASDSNAANLPRTEKPFGNPQIDFILQRSIVTCLRSHHFLLLPSSTILCNST